MTAAPMSYPIHHDTVTGFSHREDEAYDVLETAPDLFAVYQGSRWVANFDNLASATAYAAGQASDDDDLVAPFKPGDAVLFNSTASDGPREVFTTITRRLTTAEADTEGGFMFELRQEDASGRRYQAFACELTAPPAALRYDWTAITAAPGAGMLYAVVYKVRPDGDQGAVIAHFYGDDAEARAEAYAAHSNAPEAAQPTLAGAQVWTVTIAHRHGDNLYINATEAGAKAALLGYVDENWRAEMRGEEPPADPDERISAYFDGVDDESCAIESFIIGA